MINFRNINKNDKKVWLTLSPDYANIGDIAISLVQKQILQEAYPNRKIIEIPMLDYFKYKDIMKELMSNDDIITIIGGGNMGNIYIEGEIRRRNIISSFPNNNIISFPQSIDFENSIIGQKEFQKSIDIYSKHKKLTILSREQKSYDIMKSNFKNRIKLVPDTVIYLAGKMNLDEIYERDKILLCFRNDKEKITNSNITYSTIDLLTNHDYKDIELIDTYLGNIHFNLENKHLLFQKIIKKFMSAELVITDRLHGMVLALITKTPCIAFDNSNKKISSTYNTWLKEIPYIKLLDNFEEIEILNSIKKFSELKQNHFEIDLSNNFITLFEELKTNVSN